MKKNTELFNLPAGVGRPMLHKRGRAYKTREVKAERIRNARAVYEILDGTRKAQAEKEDKDFTSCFQNLRSLSVRGNEKVFMEKYEKYKKSPDFPEQLAARIINQKVRFSGGEDGVVTLWTVVNCDEIVSLSDDPSIDIREDGTGKMHNLFLFDIMRNMVFPR